MGNSIEFSLPPRWNPGEPLKGELVVTTQNAFNVSRTVVYLKGRIRVQKAPEPEISASCWKELDDAFVAAMSINDSNEKNGSRIPKTEIETLAPSSTFRKPHEDYQIFMHGGSGSHKYNIIEFSETLPNVLRFKRGVTVVPFVLDPPKNDIINCIPTGELRHLSTASIEYYVQAMIYYPSSYFSFGLDKINLRWSNKAPINVYSPMAKSCMLPPVIKHFDVRYWDAESLGFGQMLKYTVGLDTASEVFPMVLELQVPDPISGVVFLDDLVTIKIYYDKRAEKLQLVPEMEISGLNVELQSLVVHNDQVFKGYFMKKETIGSVKHATNCFDPIAGYNMRNLLYGMKIESKNLLASCITPHLSVFHFLFVTVKVKVAGKETDGTKQRSTSVRACSLINIAILPE